MNYIYTQNQKLLKLKMFFQTLTTVNINILFKILNTK